MKLEVGLSEIRRDDSSLVTVGTFDGVHVGHRAILLYLVERAKESGGASTVVTFDPHPREVVQNEAVPLLTTVDERARIMEDLGVDRLIVIPFTREFAALRAETFVEEYLVGTIGMKEIVIGYDHAFGKDRSGNRDLLGRLAEDLGYGVDLVPPAVLDQHVVSSTGIRRLLLEAGDVGGAAEMLGRWYSLRGTVVPGAARGRSIGFPTANIQVDHPRKLVPREGVYAVMVNVDSSGRLLKGMMNIGRRPTFGGGPVKIEVHIIDFESELYERSIEVLFVRRLRDEMRFASIDDLVRQLNEDKQRCIGILNGVSSPPL
jgi:riboflavin kinase/FMN adenylyltransferase